MFTASLCTQPDLTRTSVNMVRTGFAKKREGLIVARSLVVSILLLCVCEALKADLFEDLSELKKICDADLLTEDECATRRQKILAKYDGDSEEWFCNYAGEATAPTQFSDGESKGFTESASASAIVKEILDEAGLAPNFVVRPASVSNAAASARFGYRYIDYNPSFVAQLKRGTQTNWAVYSVMAHEIGHHLQGHTLSPGGSRPDMELEADDYSGFILAKLDSSLANAKVAMKTLGSDVSSGTHPARADRLAAIERGWNRGRSNRESDPISLPDNKDEPVPPTIPPSPDVTYTDSCVVAGVPVLIAANGEVVRCV